MERPLTVQFGEVIINTGKTTIAEAYEVAVAYGATKKDTVHFRTTMTRNQLDTAIRNLEHRRNQVDLAGFDAAPKRRRDWGVLNAINAERDALNEKIARLRNLYRNYDSIIDA